MLLAYLFQPSHKYKYQILCTSQLTLKETFKSRLKVIKITPPSQRYMHRLYKSHLITINREKLRKVDGWSHSYVYSPYDPSLYAIPPRCLTSVYTFTLDAYFSHHPPPAVLILEYIRLLVYICLVFICLIISTSLNQIAQRPAIKLSEASVSLPWTNGFYFPKRFSCFACFALFAAVSFSGPLEATIKPAQIFHSTQFSNL